MKAIIKMNEAIKILEESELLFLERVVRIRKELQGNAPAIEQEKALLEVNTKIASIQKAIRILNKAERLMR